MALISPGIQVSVTDESQYAPTAVGTIPLIVIATSQDKTSGTSTATAVGTTKANAEKTKLSAIKNSLSKDQVDLIVSQAQALADRQIETDDPGILPKVGLEDVPQKEDEPT